MLFYSLNFIFFFLPLTLATFFYIETRFGRRAAIVFLVVMSLVFYGSWNPTFVPIMCLSIVVNYFLGRYLQIMPSLWLLWAGLLANLGLLGYFKYTNFFLDILKSLGGPHWHVEGIVLPLGISFYTFQQISWLVDSYAKNVDTRTEGFWRYALFVCFFPHLVAGPLVDHSEMMPQFSRDTTFRPRWSSIAIGLSIFIIGLAKKVILAEAFAAYSTPVFTDAAHGTVPCTTAWVAGLCYTFQVYFDFSGYSDMAVGLARMFNIRLPMNFNSPYKESSIIGFWKCWHMTMTRFFQTYVYTPLSISLLRLQGKYGIRSNVAIYIAVFVTLVAIGFWHGANWTFIVFGILHGCAIVFNRLWQGIQRKLGLSPLPKALGVFLTYSFFMLTCIIYRAENMGVAWNMYVSMFSPEALGIDDIKLKKISLLCVGVFICFFMPNTQQILQSYRPVLDFGNVQQLARDAFLYKMRWRPAKAWFVILIVLSFLSLDLLLDANKVQEFIYFQF